MRRLQSEYLLKGVYLGLLLFVALQEPSWGSLFRVAACTFGGLVLALLVAAYQKRREGYRVAGRLPAFVLFLLLESPALVYSGILVGLTLGAFSLLGTEVPSGENDPRSLLLTFLIGGAVLGVVFGVLRQVHKKEVRLGLSLALAVALVAGLLYGLGQFGNKSSLNPTDGTLFANQLMLGMLLFYLLTFAGHEEETEVEVAAICGGIGLSLGMLISGNPTWRTSAFVVPLFLFFGYTMYVMPRLRIFKHALRGYSFARVGRFRPALIAFRRALQLDPANALAREGLWSVHRALDLNQLANDPQTLALVDLDLCVDRAGTLLQTKPTPAQLEEAQRLLELVLSQKPAMKPAILYWQTVAHTHAHQFDQAIAALEALLDPAAYAPTDPQRRSVLYRAWQLALLLHPELNRRVGTPQLSLPGRRMDAIGAVERQLANNSDDKSVWDLKRLLYSALTEEDFNAAVHPAPASDEAAGHPVDFDYAYAQQLGLALINDNAHWRRGAEYLLIAARGLPNLGPSLFSQIAQANERAGNLEGAWHHYELAKRAGRAVGPKSLGDADRHAYFAAVKFLAESAAANNNLDAAIENYHLYTEYERSGVETLRLLADLYEKKQDPLMALRVTEQALVYDGKNKDLLERKDKYYYSVMPADLKARIELIRGAFDSNYCLKKARMLLDRKDADLDLLDWASHLAELAQVAQPDSLTAKVLRARVRLRRGERDEAIGLLESVHTPKPEHFNGDDEEAWFTSCRLLGDLNLELGKPEEAVRYYLDYRKSYKSGADTLFKLGQAYEQVGDLKRAAKCYEQVTAYDGHPLVYEARDALYRVQSQQPSVRE